ncbi:hypothetical protein [Ferrovibrio sp.]|uniref:hypothetical protein n=1 Tax=Ferrovibrio sp. TaxID=1917215 RepID=UPI0025BC363D|nr:hypothetical protein [Ferrovibrio sp.]MBX3455169.1 hypothetical protein [Ferrovibrio sp.]
MRLLGFSVLLGIGLCLTGLPLAHDLAAQDKPAPAILLPEGTVLANGHVLGGRTEIQPIPGQAIVRFDDNTQETWDVVVENGETRVFRADGSLVARAELVARERDGHPSCFVYQVHIAPEWLAMPKEGTANTGKPDIATVDDRVYSFREAPCK